MIRGVRLRLAGGFVFIGVMTLLCVADAHGQKPGDVAASGIVDAFEQRLKHIAGQIEAVAQAADLSARQVMVRPGALLNVPLWEQRAFGSALVNQPGSLAHAYPTSGRSDQATEHDVVLLSVRAWQLDGARIARLVDHCQGKGWRVTLIASANGKPRHLRVDHFIDNGAPDGSAEHGPLNALANLTLGWMWCAEYAGAMSRKGRLPAVLAEETEQQGQQYNEAIRTVTGRHRVVATEMAFERGQLATAYLNKVMHALEQLVQSECIQKLGALAPALASGMAEGGQVFLGSQWPFAASEMQDAAARWTLIRLGNEADLEGLGITGNGPAVWLGAYSRFAALMNHSANPGDAAGLLVIDFEANAAGDEEASQRHPTLRKALAVPGSESDVCQLSANGLRLGQVNGLMATLAWRVLDAAVAEHLRELEESE